eukprot:5641018-Prymnesium_polylepis.1
MAARMLHSIAASSVWPRSHAMNSGVSPFSVAWLMAAPSLTSIAASSMWPDSHARKSGVVPWALALTTAPLQSSIAATSRRP